MIKLASLGGCSALALALSITPLMATSAAAQDADSDAASASTAIVVTGSRIRHDPLDQPEPVTFIDNQDITRTGLSSAADVLQRLPGAGGGLNTKFNSSGNFGNPPDGGGVGAGSAEIDLRYLGSRRTLVLVDGLRWVNGSSASGIPGSTDLNSIPDGMIDHIEVLNDGASPIYGSDAMAGVVNIITKKKWSGLSASAQVGEYRQGDGLTQNYNLTWGTVDAGSGTSLVVGLNYVKQDAVLSKDRAISLYPVAYGTSCFDGGCSSATPLGRFIVDPYNNGGYDLTLKAPVSGTPVFNPLDPTGPTSDFKDFTTADRFNFAQFNRILTPNKRYGAFLNFSQDLGSNVHFTAKLVYNHRDSENEAAPLPLFIGPDAGNGNLLDTISIDATNPYNPFGVTLDSGANGGTANYTFVARRMIENGDRRYYQSVDTYYMAATLDGDFKLGAGNWHWDANAIYSTNDAKQTFLGNVNALKVQQALGPLSACTGSCVPLNVFGGVGSITPQMLNFIAFTEHDRSSQRLVDMSANLTGNLFELPAGPVGIAVGYEYRQLGGNFNPDPVVAAGYGSDIPALPASGKYHANEVYGELDVPVLKDTPLFYRLDLSGALRHSEYSTSGNTTTFKGGVNWRPVPDMLLRGTYAQGFRAPSIGELFGAASRADLVLVDPCSDLLTQTNSTIAANCVANGVPASGSYVQNNPQLPVITGGNPDLAAEKSRSWVIGGVYSPDWARSSGLAALSLEANYYSIKVTNAIQAIDAGTLLDRCYSLNDALACSTISRTSSGAISQICGLLQNIGGIKTRGLDLTLNMRTRKSSLGSFGLNWSSNFLFDYELSVPASSGFAVTRLDGQERGNGLDQAYPHFKSNATVDWTGENFNLSVTGRYINGVTESTGNRMNSVFYTDFQLGFTPSFLDRRFGIAVGVNNVFNVAPPACYTCSLNGYDPTTYDVPGQFGYVRLTFKM